VPPAEGGFGEDELVGLPEPVQRWFRGAVAPGTPLARAARLRMDGRIRLGGRWFPFRAREVLAPHVGFVWPASVLGVLRGSDRFVDGEGAMDWRAFGRWSVVHADGPDTSRSAAGRGAAEGMWVPTSLLPRFGVTWRAEDASRIVARFTGMGGHPVEVHLQLRTDGQVVRFWFDRWGDPDETGSYGVVPFGGDALAWATFDGITIPSEGRVGWWYGTPRFQEGEFFRYRITDLELVR
jgi:hypothetical protein